MEFQLLLDKGANIAETPVWDGRKDCLYWTDLSMGDVHRYTISTGEDACFHAGNLIGSAIPTDDPDKVVAVVQTGAYIFDLSTGVKTLLCDPNQGDLHLQYNDSRVDAAGRLYLSTVVTTPDPEHPDLAGKFYMLDTDHKTIRVLVDRIGQYNGMCWNKDNTRMFVVDTNEQKLMAFDYDLATGPVGPAQEVLDFKGKQGMPDGMAIDCDDNLYICHWSGVISVWDKDLQLVREIEGPVCYLACCGFGGAEYKDLYLATARYDCSEDYIKTHPGTGGIFVSHTDIPGRGDNFFPL